jgi:four helix bundle protein
MGTIKKFEELEIWKLARELNKLLDPYLLRLQEMKSFALKNQLEASAGSVMDNIAEGFERGGSKEFFQFLAISKGSLGEVRSQIFRIYDKSIIEETTLTMLQSHCSLLASKISSLMTYLNNSSIKGHKYLSVKTQDKLEKPQIKTPQY